MTKLLVLGYVWPEPNSSAAGSHMLNLLDSFLQQNWQITFASPALLSEHREDLPARGIDEVSIALNSSSFDEFIDQLQPDIVLFDRFMLEEQFGWRVSKICPNALKILDTEDLHFLRNARHQAHKQNREVRQTDLQSDMAKREIAAIFRCDLSLIISPIELSLLIEEFKIPADILLHIPLMVDLTNRPQQTDISQRSDFISIGNFRHAPNWDAVLYLKQKIWPAIRKQLPNASLNIYGAYPPPKATQLHAPKDGFLIKGWAEDSQQVMQQAKICLAPLRFGAGLKGKLVEAMLCGTPSVTTDIGAEGMQPKEDDSNSWPGFVASEPETFVERAVKLYQDEQLWQQKQQQGYKVLAKRFDKQQIQARLLHRVNQLQSSLATHRQKNFIGQMLQHHHLASTQYMSQWIEAKNK